MRKNSIHSPATDRKISQVTENFLHIGLFCILLCALRLLQEILSLSNFSPATAARFGGMLEYILAALAVLTAGSYTIERAVRQRKK